MSEAFQQFQAMLSAKTQSAIESPQQILAPATRLAVQHAPCWWLVLVPDAGLPVITSYQEEAAFNSAVLAAVRTTDLGSIFAFQGLRVYVGDQPDPFLVHANGRVVRLKEEVPLQLDLDGSVGAPWLRQLAAAAKTRPPATLDYSGDYTPEEYAVGDGDDLSEMISEAFAVADEVDDVMDDLP